MPINCHELGITYFPVPKVGSSTMRAVLNTIRTGSDITQIDVGKSTVTFDRTTRALPFDEARQKVEDEGSELDKVTMLRDPVARFLSGYDNKILSGKVDEKIGHRLGKFDLPGKPDLETFVDNLDAYRSKSRLITQHFHPQSHFLGEDLGYFDHVFRLERFAEFEKFLNNRFGRKISFPQFKRRRQDRVGDVPQPLRDKIAALYESDYALLEQLSALEMERTLP